MIATRLGLAIACGLALVLAVVVVLDSGRESGPVDRALVPGFDAVRVTRLAWTGRGAATAIVRSPGTATGTPSLISDRDAVVWRWVDPPGSADPATVADVLAALRGARWHRRADLGAAGAPRITLTVTSPTGELAIAIGAPLEGTEQQWLAIGDRALLVDAWVARALAPAPLALRVRAPLAAAPSARKIQLGGATLEGTPRRLVQPPLLLDPRVADTVERALAELAVTELTNHPVAATGDPITVDDVVVRDAGPCPGSPARRAIDGTHGPGCVDAARWDAVGRAQALLASAPDQLVERRPVPLDPANLTLVDGAQLDLTARPRLVDRDADPVRVAELIAALAAPGEPVPLPKTPPTGALVATDRAKHAITLDTYTTGIVARRGEPIALRLGDGAWKLIVRSSRELVDPVPWREEPTTITVLELDDTKYTRGAVLGEWTRTGPGRDDPRAVDQLVAALAAPRTAPHPHAGPVRHRLRLQVAPIGGTLHIHEVELGDADATGCNAKIRPAGTATPFATEQVQLGPEICALVRGLTR